MQGRNPAEIEKQLKERSIFRDWKKSFYDHLKQKQLWDETVTKFEINSSKKVSMKLERSKLFPK